jgi:hypothetical protein
MWRLSHAMVMMSSYVKSSKPSSSLKRMCGRKVSVTDALVVQQAHGLSCDTGHLRFDVSRDGALGQSQNNWSTSEKPDLTSV